MAQQLVRRWPDSVIGTARGLASRTEVYGDGGSITTITFRIEPEGEGARPVAVQVKGIGFNGVVGDGELVEARGTLRNGVLETNEVYSHDTGATLKVRWSWAVIKKTGMAAGAVVLAIMAFVALALVGVVNPGEGRLDDKVENTGNSDGGVTRPTIDPTFEQEFEQRRREAYQSCLAEGHPQDFCDNFNR